VLTSVEELIAPTLKAAFSSEQLTFISGGREDVDVRMLGSGRPFVMRCSGSRRVPARATDELVAELQAKINAEAGGLVRVVHLKRADKSRLEWLKSVENSKRKTYGCVVFLPRPVAQEDIQLLNRLRDLTIIQKTPLRVLHRWARINGTSLRGQLPAVFLTSPPCFRRSAADREKQVYSVRTRRLNDSYLYVEVEAEAGTYIKELIHGDFGRTKPSFRSLLKTDADIIQLDVLSIDCSESSAAAIECQVCTLDQGAGPVSGCN